MVLGHLSTRQLRKAIHIPTTVHKQAGSKGRQRLLKEVLKYSPQERLPLPSKTEQEGLDLLSYLKQLEHLKYMKQWFADTEQ